MIPVLPLVGLALGAWWLTRSASTSSNLGPSPNFTWAELADDAELDNQARANLTRLAVSVLEPLRAQFGPLRVTSAYRDPEANAAAGGVATSLHQKGLAADVYAINGATHEEMAEWLYASSLPVDEVIVERHTGHLHVAASPSGSGAREFLQTDDGESYDAWSA